MKFHKIISIFLIFCSIFLLLYVIYRSEIVWNGERRNYYLSYLLFSSIFLIFSIIFYYVKESIKNYLAIIFLSFVFGLYTFEFYLMFLTNPFSIGNKSFGTKTIYQKYKNLKKKNKNVVMKIFPSVYLEQNTDLFPLSGISNSETIYSNENGYYFIYKSDRYGFNNPDNLWDNENEGYLVVGDSFVHGAAVNRPNDISSVLRTLSAKPVLNLGYGGNGPLIEYATLREFITPNIKKVLWVYYEFNDLLELEKELKSEILINYLMDENFSQNLKQKQQDVDRIASMELSDQIKILEREKIKNQKNNFTKFIKIWNLRYMISDQNNEGNYFDNRSASKKISSEFKQIIKSAKEVANKNGAEFYFVYLPDFHRFKLGLQFEPSYSEIKKFLNASKITFIDINEEVFSKMSNPLELFPSQSNGHYNAKGYRMVANAIYKYLKP